MSEYIDKAEAISRFSFYNGDRIPERDVDGFPNAITFHDAKMVIRSIRPADVRPVVRGSWKYFRKQNKAVCTVCSFERDLDNNFGKAIACPNCGADMRGGDKP